MNRFEFVRATSTPEAVKLLGATPDAMVHAAGIDLLDRMKADLERPSRLVALRGVGGLSAIEKGNPHKIGAMATLAQVAAAFSEGPLAALGHAAGEAATPQIRNVATVGGNLCQRPRCWYYRLGEVPCLKKGGKSCPALEGDNRYHAIFDTSPCPIVHPSNLATALVALGATVQIQGPNGAREIAAEKFFVLPQVDITREVSLGRDEVVTGVTVPAHAGAKSAYLEGREKESFDWALVSAAVVLTDGDARVVLGSVAPVPRRAVEAEKLLAGKKITAELAQKASEAAFAEARPLAGNAYKVKMGAVIAKRAILAAAGLWKEDR